jgi:hypothetical protein
VKPIIFIFLLLLAFGCEQATEPIQPSPRPPTLTGRWYSIVFNSAAKVEYPFYLHQDDTVVTGCWVVDNYPLPFDGFVDRSHMLYLFNRNAHTSNSIEAQVNDSCTEFIGEMSVFNSPQIGTEFLGKLNIRAFKR